MHSLSQNIGMFALSDIPVYCQPQYKVKYASTKPDKFIHRVVSLYSMVHDTKPCSHMP